MDMAIDCLRHRGRAVFVFLHSTDNPSDESWAAAMQLMQEVREQRQLALDQLAALVFSDGGAPNARQRAALTHNFPIRTAVLTNALANPVKKGVATALRWMNPQILFCSPKDAMQAFDHAGLAPPFDDVRAVLEELQARLPPNAVLGEVTRVVGWRRA